MKGIFANRTTTDSYCWNEKLKWQGLLEKRSKNNGILKFLVILSKNFCLMCLLDREDRAEQEML